MYGEGQAVAVRCRWVDSRPTVLSGKAMVGEEEEEEEEEMGSGGGRMGLSRRCSWEQ